jgi:branched-chain amino acid transport system substrate-binding protein
VIPQCLGGGNAAQIPQGFEGIKVAGSYTIDTTDPDHQLFQAAMKKWGKGEFTGTAPTGWQAILGLARALSGLTGEVTRETVNTAIKTMQPQDIPLGVGGKFQCDGKQIQLGPNVCSKSGLIGDGDKDGNVRNFKLVEVDDLLKLPSS